MVEDALMCGRVQLLPGDIYRAFPHRTEKDVAKTCDELISKMGGQIERTNPPHRVKQSFGVPDRRYRIFGAAFYFELKKPDGQLTRDQYRFLNAELEHNAYAACGGLIELTALVDSLRTYSFAKQHFPDVAVLPTVVCQRILSAWAARGFRGEPKPKRSLVPSTTTGVEK